MKKTIVFSASSRMAAAALCLLASAPALASESNETDATTADTIDRAETLGSDAMALAEMDEGQGQERADDSRRFFSPGGRLLLTGGVTQIEGAGGGGLAPWALIGTYGTRDQFGASAFATGVNSEDFSLSAYGGTIAYGNRIELSIARQNFNLNAVGAALGLGRTFTISQTIVGAKVRLFGDAVLEQDSLLPQVSVGVQYKDNNQPGVVIGALAARDDNDFDYYVSATKIFLSQSLLLNGTARATRANQFGILGFGGPTDNSYSVQFEGSAALLLNRHFAIGGEYRTKPDRLGFKEEDAFDVFVAYAPVHNITATLAYVDLGNIALRSQHAVYASLQFSF
ncbi:MAG: DUF3034 family protein [Sphingopyxis sp.]